MSEVSTIGQGLGAPDVRGSIARASQATGVDFGFLLAQAKLESGLNPHARAGTSSATGLYQFLNSTWLNTLDKHGANHGLGWADAAIDNGRIADPAMRSQIMALRYDPDASALMAAELTRDNQSALRDTLGREPDHAELYLAHFLGSDGATRFLSAMQQNPGASAAALFPKQAAANRQVFYGDNGAPRSLGEVMDMFRQRLDQAMAQEGGYVPGSFAPSYGVSAASAVQETRPMGPLAREFHEAAAGRPAFGGGSMMDTLQQTFGGTGSHPASLPGNVRAAYSKLKAFGL